MCFQKSAHNQIGFSLVEAMVGAALLLVAALGVAYFVKGKSVSNLDSLKACQDVNEEILTAISSLAQGSFSYTYGTASNYPKRECATCDQAELGLSPALRWSPETALTTSNLQPTVRPHFLQLSAMNYLSTLYNSNADYCSDEKGGPIPGTDLNSTSSPFNFFKSSGDASNLLKDRKRYGNTRMFIRLVNEQGDTSCTRPFLIRPQARGFGDSSPVLDKNVINPATAARARIGFKVDLVTTYREAGASPEIDPSVCTATKSFFYQPEGYNGSITVTPVTSYPDPATPLSPRGLPMCNGGEPVVAFTTTFTKAKRDSVLLCRNRSVIGTWRNPAPCDPTNPTSPNCKCEPSNGCHNTWPEFATNPDGAPNPTLDTPSNSWFPCDILGAQLVAAGILASADQLRVSFNPEGNGTYTFEVSDIRHESPQSRPKLVRVDVIEVDSALNSSNDNPSTPFAVLGANFMGRDPGQVCTDCDGSPAFMCGSCPGPCDCLSTVNTCACETYANANVCECDPTHPSCDSCAGISDPDARKCCEDPASCTKCRSCTSWSLSPGTWSCGLSCTVETCTAWEPGTDPMCPGDVSRNGICSGPNPCEPSCQESETVCCRDGATRTRHWCAANSAGDDEYWSSQEVCRFPNPSATSGSWTTESYPLHSTCSSQTCASGLPKLCDPNRGCYCL